MPKVLHSNSDISGRDYTAFLTAASMHFASFSLVWRAGLPYDAGRHAVGRDLRQHEIAKRRGNCWPGTQLLGSTETIITYTLNPESKTVLERAGSVFGWVSPHYPEDLAFYRANGRCGFASVAHEELAWVLDTEFASDIAPSWGFSEEDLTQRAYEMFDYVG